MKIIWRIVIAQICLKAKYISAQKYSLKFCTAQINGSHMGCSGPGHHTWASGQYGSVRGYAA